MWVLLLTVFGASLLGSLHCVGMCGPFALVASASKQDGGSAWIPTAAYSCGRLATYSLVGFVFGSLGLALNVGTSFAPWQQSATFFAGTLMILVGLIALARQFGWRVQLPNLAQPLQRVLQNQFQLVRRQPPNLKAFLIGGLSCLMPCGWLYTFAIVAAGTGSPVLGALVMMVFWLGTVPVMVALPLGLTKIGHSLRRRIPLGMATLVILVGAFTIAFRAPVVLGDSKKIIAGTDNLIESVQTIDHGELPCCDGE